MTESQAANSAMGQEGMAVVTPSLLDQLLSWENEKWGAPLDEWRALVPGMAHQANKVTEKFLDLMSKRQLSNLCVRESQLQLAGSELSLDSVLEGKYRSGVQEARSYRILGRELAPGSLVVMAVRIAEYGKDLYVEWEHFAFKIDIFGTSQRWLRGILAVVPLTWPLGGLLFPLWWAWRFFQDARKGHRVTTGSAALEGYRQQDAWAFKEAVNTSLKEALDLIGISAEMIREMPKEKRAI